MEIWTAAGNLNVARDAYGIVPLPGDKALIISGASGFPNMTDTCEIFDHGTNTWTLTGSMSRPNGEGMYEVLNTGNVLAIGGLETGLVRSAVCELYDPNTETWALTGSLNIARADHGANWTLPSGKILVTGGQTGPGGAATDTSEIYDPNTEVWSFAANLYTPISNMAFSTCGDGRPLWAGGWTQNHGSDTERSYTYDEGSDTWIRQGDLPNVFGAPNCRPSITLQNGNVFVLGGYINFDGTKQTRAFIFDQNTNTWSSSSAAPFQLVESTLALIGTTEVLQYAVRFGVQTQIYNWATDTWRIGPSLPIESSGQMMSNTSIVFSDGKILSTGGQDDGQASLDTTNIFSGVPPMSIAFVQKKSDAATRDGLNTATSTLNAPTGTGNLLVLWIGAYLGSGAVFTYTVTDDAGNTYTSIPSTQTGRTDSQAVMFYCPNSIAGATIVTVTLVGDTFHQVELEFIEFSGCNTSTPLDTGNFHQENPAAASCVSGLITPVQTNVVLFSAVISSDNLPTSITTPGWISYALNTVEGQCAGYLIGTTVSSQQATYAHGGPDITYSANIASFKAAATGTSAKQKASTFLGM